MRFSSLKILLTFLLSTASCNFFICLLFQTLQDSCFSQQSAPASQVSPSAYPLPAHFPSSSLLLPEVNTFIQCLQSFCLPTSDEASLMHTAPLCSASSASWAPADPPYILRGAGRQRFWTVCWTRSPLSKERLYNESLWSCYHRLHMLWLLLTGCFWAVPYMCHIWEQFVAASTHLPHIRGRAALGLEPIFRSVTFKLSQGSGGKYSGFPVIMMHLLDSGPQILLGNNSCELCLVLPAINSSVVLTSHFRLLTSFYDQHHKKFIFAQ